MTSPFAQLVAQAELNFADLSRRAVESVTAPVKAKSQEVVAEVTASVKASVKGIIVKAVLGLFAVVMAVIALGYALSALHGYLATVLGPIAATLAMAGAFLLLAIIAIIVMMAWPTGTKASTSKAAATSSDRAARAVRDAEAAVARARVQADAAARSAKSQAGAQAQHAQSAATTAPAAAMSDVKGGLGAIASALGEAGFRREQAGLRAGLALAEQLKPMQIVALALVGGFIAGNRQRRRRH